MLILLSVIFQGMTPCSMPTDLPRIVEIASPHPVCFVKPHPLDKGSPHTAAVLASSTNMVQTDENVYSLLSYDQISTVVTLSSSVGIEAGYFGKNVHFVFRPPASCTLEGISKRPPTSACFL